MTPTTTTRTLQAGEPITHRGITVVALFPTVDPVAQYVTLAEASPLGFTITEVDESGDVGELIAINPTPHRVLLYDGEELEGAKQNRILNVSVLVEAGATLAVPVSCIEAGRWAFDNAPGVSPAFQAAARTTSPRVRRAKEEHLREEPLARGVAQNAVWNAVDMKQQEHAVHSPTAAYSDVVHHERSRMTEFVDAFVMRPGQCGLLLGYGGEVVCMDAVSSPQAYTQLHEALLTGYVLDSLAHVGGTGITAEQAHTFLADVADATTTRRPSAGLGTDMRLAGTRVVGTGLALDGEILQVTAYRTDDDRHDPTHAMRPTHIARPTRRRLA